jgi:hypothetical protein
MCPGWAVAVLALLRRPASARGVVGLARVSCDIGRDYHLRRRDSLDCSVALRLDCPAACSGRPPSAVQRALPMPPSCGGDILLTDRMRCSGVLVCVSALLVCGNDDAAAAPASYLFALVHVPCAHQAGAINHLAAAYLLCEQINHGINLQKCSPLQCVFLISRFCATPPTHPPPQQRAPNRAPKPGRLTVLVERPCATDAASSLCAGVPIHGRPTCLIRRFSVRCNFPPF